MLLRRGSLLHHLVIIPPVSTSEAILIKSLSRDQSFTSNFPRRAHSSNRNKFADAFSNSPQMALETSLTMMRRSFHSTTFSRQFSSSSGKAHDIPKDSTCGGEVAVIEPDSDPLTVTITEGLKSPESATAFLQQLTDEQRQLIYHTLNIEVLRHKYEKQIGLSKEESHVFLSKFGRPAKAKEDPTGTLCEVSPRWLWARLDEKAPPPSASAIWAVAVKNALPFIGFGFLDNLIMILAGDYIDITIGTALGISTMAAAALGNTISDMAGIGSAWYVEELASKVGVKDPVLTPKQMQSGAVRWACNLGRAGGVVIGCLLGMFPLLFLPSGEEKKRAAEERQAEIVAAGR